MAAKWNLLCSSGDVDSLERMINTFWVSTSYTVNRVTLSIEHPERTPPANTRVRKLGGRYRFERQA